MEITTRDIKILLLIVGIGAAILVGGYYLILGIWWVWFTSLKFLFGIFGITIGFWEALALFFFWMMFLPKKVIGNLVNDSYKKVKK